MCAQQPAKFSVPSFGHLFWETMRSFIICKNEGNETSLSCSESCTGWDHLSDLIESLGCSAVGSMQPWTSTYTYICEFQTVFSVLSEMHEHLEKCDPGQSGISVFEKRALGFSL